MEILVPMAGLIDKEAGKLEQNIQKLDGKLSNAAVVDKAPAEAVEKERAILAYNKIPLEKIKEQIQKIQAL
ncbi:MAG: hypothetical protein ACI4NJ_12405 [Cellvibrio sp.]